MGRGGTNCDTTCILPSRRKIMSEVGYGRVVIIKRPISLYKPQYGPYCRTRLTRNSSEGIASRD